MKKFFLLPLLFLAQVSFGQITKKVCFLGNSYTYVNDMPGIVSDLATADGNTLVKDQNTPGGYTLMGHSSNSTSLAKIAQDNWDYVVLQDQSQLPSFPWSQVQTDVFPYAEILVDSIRSANECAIPLFFNTWGRLNGDPQWDSINTFDKMNQRLYNSYGWMAYTHSAKRAPVGMGFNHVQDDMGAPVTLATLFSGDGSHPAIHGSYLTACIFYEIIFEVDVQGNTHIPAGISGPEATYLQFVAHHVVHDVDSIEVDFTQPLANFTFAQAGMGASFTNLSEHSFEWLWDFGDGNTSTDEHPNHTYSSTGTYDVTLTASYCGNSHDTTFQIMFLASVNEALSTFQMYPNPTSGALEINYNHQAQWAYLFLLNGQYCTKIKLNEPTFVDLPPGVYIVQVGNLRQRLIIQ